ncbi:DUF4056 domain-containing protein [Leadbetterella sp. DM7]|uniref:DUF4056 domain-containing protein n=1 Tax=Leadbetterella sp. DM7 TaxID=3235085 RepID=UPI00349EBAA4
MKKILLIVCIPLATFARVPDHLDVKTPPKRIIRTCCSFGVDVKVSVLSFLKVTDITSVADLGDHTFLGSKQEKNGIIYTRNGGFIDMGHLRDIADYTAYLFGLIRENREQGLTDFRLGKEGGLKKLSVKIPESFTDEDIARLAGKIAYDLSVWHEISTWYGASYIPLVPERYSSFSVEDAYSNLLGVHLSIKSLLSDKDYESEMTRNIRETLEELDAVSTVEETRQAMNDVKDIWWSGTAKLPSRKVLIKRQFEILGRVSPLVVDSDLKGESQYELLVPEKASDGKDFTEYYTLEIKAGFKIPVKKVFGEGFRDRLITQDDFPALIQYGEYIATSQEHHAAIHSASAAR